MSSSSSSSAADAKAKQDEQARIPGPRGYPVIGNLMDIDPAKPVQRFVELLKATAESSPGGDAIMNVHLGGKSIVFVGSQKLVNEVCDESRFSKKLHSALRNVRDLAGNGLFTAESADPEWGKAHRILMPVFGPAALRGMFEPMLDIAEQVLVKWERLGETNDSEVSDQMTRLTLDTIALCAFSTRFNLFYQTEMHPFVFAMVRTLLEAGRRGRRPAIANRIMELANGQYHEDIAYLHKIADEIIDTRRKDPKASEKRDILTTMLEAKDPVTGETMSDQNIRYQLITFLIAGHETTSGLLTFAIYELLSHPELLARAQAEADAVLGSERPRVEHLQKLTFIDKVLKETLRLWPTAPAFGFFCNEPETVIGGKYKITKDDTIMVLVPYLHRDPAVWGNEADKFDPDRFEFETYNKLPPNSWKPFGHGSRACIGRPFALQEATLFLAMLLRRFDLSLADPNYQLDVHETLTLKPFGLKIRVKRRDTEVDLASGPAVTGKPATAAVVNGAATGTEAPASQGHKLLVLYGSNAGSTESFARRIVADGARNGFSPELLPLDGAVDKISKNTPVVIVTASYEGQPPDNARKFIAWLDGLKEAAFDGVKYTVFGCGNKDWARTYQAIPKKVDSRFNDVGATRFKERGEADARGDFYGSFDSWYANFWTQLSTAVGVEVPSAKATSESAPKPSFAIEFIKSVRDPLIRHNNLQLGTIIENRELVNTSSPLARSKRHVEIELPEGMTYRAGDYLAVLPLNPEAQVDRVLRRFGLSFDTQIVIRVEDTSSVLPVGEPISVGELLSSYVELALPATKAQVEELAISTPCPPEKRELLGLIETQEAYEKNVLKKRLSVLDLVERFASTSLPFASFIRMLPVLRPRQYSISSSPLWSPTHCTLTVAVLRAPALSGTGTYEGVASTYLASLRRGAKVAVTVRPSQASFHPPGLDTPVVMVCAGTGLAPFRGFIQDRAFTAATQEDVKPAPALLFFGCDSPDVDYLYYQDELSEWEKQGLVTVLPAFSEKPEGDVKFVQHRLLKEHELVEKFVRDGAMFFVCGDGKYMAPAVHAACVSMYAKATEKGQEEAEKWMEEMERQRGRYVADVFA